MQHVDGQDLAITRAPQGGGYRRQLAGADRGGSLADILERVLDKGIVIAGDITIFLADVELLSIKVRLLVASLDKAQEMGINWWQSDPSLSAQARNLEDENRELRERLERLEAQLSAPPTPGSSDEQSKPVGS